MESVQTSQARLLRTHGHDRIEPGLVGSSFAGMQRDKSQDKSRALLESAPDAMVIVDAAGAISLANGLAEKLFGYKTEEVSSPRTLKACGPKQAHDDCRGPSSLHELRVNIQNTFKKAPTLQFQLTTLDCPSF